MSSRHAPPETDSSLRSAYAELWRLVSFKPTESQALRDFWKVWIAAMLIWAVVMTTTGIAFFPWGLLLVLVISLVISRGAKFYWRRTRASRPG